jgi:hypothetical protein
MAKGENMEARRTKYLKKGFVITVLYPSNQPENGKSSVLYNAKCAPIGSREFQPSRMLPMSKTTL